MRTILAATLCLPPLCSTAAAAEDEVTVFEPSSQWVADFAEGRCLLSRQFMSGTKELKLQFIQYFPRISAFLMLATEDGFGSGRLEYRFGDASEFDEVKRRFGTSWGGLKGTLFSVAMVGPVDTGKDEERTEGEVRPIDFSRVEAFAATHASLTVKGSRGIYRIETGNLEAPVKVLNQCTSNLVDQWGLDEAAHRSLSRGVTLENATTIYREIEDSYPSKAVRQKVSALVSVRVIVDAEGLPLDCSLQNDMSMDIFAKGVCGILLRKGRFSPALDAEGNPLSRYWATSITYGI